MTHAIDYPAAPQAGSQALGRVRSGARALAVVLTGLLAVSAAAAAGLALAGVAYSGDGLQLCRSSAWIGVGHAPPGCIPVSGLPAMQRWAYALVALVRAAPALLILWNLRALFRLYAEGVVFERANAAHLKAIGAWLAAAALVPLAGHLFLSGLGLEIDGRWFHLSSVQDLVLGGLVLVVGQVMELGHEIEEERKGFV